MMREKTERKPSSKKEHTAAAPAKIGRFRRTCPFSGPNAIKPDYKDIRTLSRYVTERGRMMPRRITYVSAAGQRELSIAIKRARFLALMPYLVK